MRKLLPIIALTLITACGGQKQSGTQTATPAVSVPAFVGDSAMANVYEQCSFGPRVPGTDGHRLCGDYIARRFAAYGLTVVEQTADLQAWNGDRLPMRNIIASLNPDAEMRLLVTAHWDSRPWADNDPDPQNHRTPVIAANDGASGVAVMIELARVLRDCPLDWGVDFVCFDCEDYGVAQWAEDEYGDDTSDTWALGSQVWAASPHISGYRAVWGINLDMVGGRGSQFWREGVSLHFARNLVDKVWGMASSLGLSKWFPQRDGGYVTDDHLPINQRLGIPAIDIVPHFPNCPQSSFGPTWHTVADTPDNIDPEALSAVGRLMVNMICNPL